MVEGRRGQFIDIEPGRVTRDRRSERGGHEGQIRGGDGALAGIAVDIAAGLQLFEVGDIGQVYLGREMSTE